MVRCILVHNVGGFRFSMDKTYDNYYLPLKGHQLERMLTGPEKGRAPGTARRQRVKVASGDLL